MRAVLTALVLGLAGAGAAHAADLGDPVWDKAPDRADWAKAYPTAAAQAGVAGSVKMRCSAGATGALQGCAVVSESPAGQGFGAAALSLAAGMALKPTAADGTPIAGRNLIVPVKFEPALLKPGALVTNPDWLKVPAAGDLAQYYPATGTTKGGRVILQCLVTNRGLMDSCTVKTETPAGRGYAQAALAATPLFLMRPMTVDGLPVGGAAINIPVNFVGSPRSTSPDLTLRVLSSAPWLAAPTVSDMAAAFPKSAIGKIASGHVVLRCGMSPNGRLQGCDPVSEAPRGHGFEIAAQSLVRDFRVITDPNLNRYGNLRIDVPFDFRDPTQAIPAVEIHNPLWVQSMKPEEVVRLFPPEAIKAGYKAGVATVACTTVHSGVLTDCAVESEEPADLGFGAAALKIAAVMKMNPWTSQGAPVDGMKIQVPIRLVLPDASAPAVAATPPTK
jgi:TonB family protein